MEKKNYYEALTHNNITTFSAAFVEGLEDFLQVSKIIDGYSLLLDGEEGFIILEEEINYQIIFVDNKEFEKTIMFTFTDLEKAKVKLKEIKCEYLSEC